MNGYQSFWSYIKDVLITEIYFNGLETFRLESGEFLYPLELSNGFISDTTSFLLGVRLRQLRMKRNSCTAPKSLKDNFPECISSYSMYSDEEEDFKSGWKQLKTEETPDEAFTYQSALKLAGDSSNLIFGTYSGGGYVANLGRESRNATNITETLKLSNWIEDQTRVVFIEILIMNPNTQLYTVINQAVEFFAGGGTFGKQEIRSVKLNKYSGSNGTVLIILQAITLLFIAYFHYSEAKELIYNRLEYFKVVFEIHIVTAVFNQFFSLSSKFHDSFE